MPDARGSQFKIGANRYGSVIFNSKKIWLARQPSLLWRYSCPKLILSSDETITDVSFGDDICLVVTNKGRLFVHGDISFANYDFAHLSMPAYNLDNFNEFPLNDLGLDPQEKIIKAFMGAHRSFLITQSVNNSYHLFIGGDCSGLPQDFVEDDDQGEKCTAVDLEKLGVEQGESIKLLAIRGNNNVFLTTKNRVLIYLSDQTKVILILELHAREEINTLSILYDSSVVLLTSLG